MDDGDRLVIDDYNGCCWILHSHRKDGLMNRYWAKDFLDTITGEDHDLDNMVLEKTYLKPEHDHPEGVGYYFECDINDPEKIKATKISWKSA